MPSFLVLHYLPEFAQTHVRWVGDAIQPPHPVVPFSCPQSFPASFPGSFLMSHVFTSDGLSIGASASVLSVNIQDWSPLGLVWSPCCRRLNVQKSVSVPSMIAVFSHLPLTRFYIFLLLNMPNTILTTLTILKCIMQWQSTHSQCGQPSPPPRRLVSLKQSLALLSTQPRPSCFTLSLQICLLQVLHVRRVIVLFVLL